MFYAAIKTLPFAIGALLLFYGLTKLILNFSMGGNSRHETMNNLGLVLIGAGLLLLGRRMKRIPGYYII
jgi:threonine/homoserine efflux transporter RhtA